MLYETGHPAICAMIALATEFLTWFSVVTPLLHPHSLATIRNHLTESEEPFSLSLTLYRAYASFSRGTKRGRNHGKAVYSLKLVEAQDKRRVRLEPQTSTLLVALP